MIKHYYSRRYRWTVNRGLLDISMMLPRVSIKEPLGTLAFAYAMPRDEGIYQCIASNSEASMRSFEAHVTTQCKYMFLFYRMGGGCAMLVHLCQWFAPAMFHWL